MHLHKPEVVTTVLMKAVLLCDAPLHSDLSRSLSKQHWSVKVRVQTAVSCYYPLVAVNAYCSTPATRKTFGRCEWEQQIHTTSQLTSFCCWISSRGPHQTDRMGTCFSGTVRLNCSCRLETPACLIIHEFS